MIKLKRGFLLRLAAPLIALLAAIAASSVFLLMIGENPFTVFTTLIAFSLGRSWNNITRLTWLNTTVNQKDEILNDDKKYAYFTINAMGMELPALTLCDPYHGRDDLRSGSGR